MSETNSSPRHATTFWFDYLMQVSVVCGVWFLMVKVVPLIGTMFTDMPPAGELPSGAILELTVSDWLTASAPFAIPVTGLGALIAFRYFERLAPKTRERFAARFFFSMTVVCVVMCAALFVGTFGVNGMTSGLFNIRSQGSLK